MLLITSVIAAALTIIFIKLSFAVIGLRRKNKVGLGSGGIDDLERAIRAQGNLQMFKKSARTLALYLSMCRSGLKSIRNWNVCTYRNRRSFTLTG
jgi:uncharacterized membrane protein YecN with MAPEG domain